MAVRIPFVTEFNGKGVREASRAFDKLANDSKKITSTIKTSFVAVGAAVGAVGFAAASFAKSAMEDQKAQVELARSLRATTKATDAQIKSVEDWISTTAKATGIADDELRPAYSQINRVVRDLSKSQKLLSLAQNISAGTGRPLALTAKAVAQAYGGQFGALRKLSPELGKLIKGGASADKVFEALEKTFRGASATAANTTAGKFQVLKVRIDEAKESIGYALLPIMEKLVRFLSEKVIPYIEQLVDVLGKKGLGEAVKTASTDMGNFIRKLDGWQGQVLDFAGAITVLYVAVKSLTIASAVAGAFSSLAGALSAVGGILGGGFAVTTGIVAGAFALILITVKELIGLLRSEQGPVFLEYLKNTAKLIANAFIFIYNTVIDTINLLPKLANLVIPFGDPVGQLGGKLDYFDYTYGAGDFKYGGGAGNFRMADQAKGGVNINFNGVVGDPVAVGLQVQNVLDYAKRRTGGR
jgi:hypothetical protein